MEIAKLVRADIKAGIADGSLPRAKYSVRIDRFAGGRSLDVTIDDVPFAIRNAARVRADVFGENPHDHPETVCFNSPEAGALEAQIEELVAAYNFDGSDSQSDYFHVNFYGHVSFGKQEHREYEELHARFTAERHESLAPERAANRAKHAAHHAQFEQPAAEAVFPEGSL